MNASGGQLEKAEADAERNLPAGRGTEQRVMGVKNEKAEADAERNLPAGRGTEQRVTGVKNENAGADAERDLPAGRGTEQRVTGVQKSEAVERGEWPADYTGSGEGAVVLIDGVCHLCQGLVKFIVPRDPAGYFRFAALQSGTGRRLLERGGMMPDRLDTVVLVEGDRYYTESAAALRIARRLRFPWPAAAALGIVPGPLRDRLYRFVARNRYRWFGRDDSCLMPSPDVRRRFLED